MIITTTYTVEGHRILEYRGIITGETIYGANLFRDLFAAMRDLVGGRSASYERVLERGRNAALEEMEKKALAMGANAVVGVNVSYATIGKTGSMLMITACGTAVKIERLS